MSKPIRPNLYNLFDPAQQAGYRPTYRARVANPNYVLEKSVTPANTLPGLLNPIEALEAWCREEGEAQTQWVRWHPEHMQTLRVGLQGAFQSIPNKLLRQACYAWQAASGGLIRFTVTSNVKHADIQLVWSDEPVFGRPYELGHNDRQIHPPCWIKQVKITLLRTTESEHARLYTTMLHELGHALGLEHSNGEKDVMHHQGWRNVMLSENDMRQLQDLYSKPVPTQFTV